MSSRVTRRCRHQFARKIISALGDRYWPSYWPERLKLGGHPRLARSFSALLLGLAISGCTKSDPRQPPSHREVIVSVRSEPQSLSWFTGHDATTYLISLLTQARLVQINASTQEVEPWLAEKWETSDGQNFVVHLRPGLSFSDGHPLSTDDVLFSLKAAFDKSSSLSDSMSVGGEPVQMSAVDARTLQVKFPAPYGPGLRLFDALPIVPKHKLQAAFEEGRFGDAWSASSNPKDVVGLGPFILTEHQAGQQLVFERNPHYFRHEQNTLLPRLDRVVIRILPNQDAQILSLQSGESDGSAYEIRPTDVALARRLAAQGSAQLLDLGPTLDPDGLWVNLRPGAFDHDSRRRWLQKDELRRAISLGVDRQQFIDTVFAGAAVPVNGPVTPANRQWSSATVPAPRFDPAAARLLLASIGLVDRDGDGYLDDDGNRHAHLTLLTQKGQSSLERGAASIRDQMQQLGLTVDVVTLDAGALIQKFLSGSGYDAAYFNLTTTDTDPASQLDFWSSTGASHVWNLGGAEAGYPWEHEIDALMARQVSTRDQAERVRLFSEVQRIFADHLPMVHFAAPRIFVAVSSRLTNLSPAVRRPQLLWAADTLDVRH